MHAAHAPQELIDSPYALRRLIATLLVMTLGATGMYVVSVVLPQVQADFGVSRSDASLPYTLLMVGFGVGGASLAPYACAAMAVIGARAQDL